MEVDSLEPVTAPARQRPAEIATRYTLSRHSDTARSRASPRRLYAPAGQGIHMLVSIPPNISVSQFVGYLKGKSSLMIFDRHANLKYKYGNRHFWCRGYYVDTVGRNKEKIAEYIRHQLDEDIMADQLSFKEYIDPFTGSKNPKA